MIRLDTQDGDFATRFDTLVDARREAASDVARDVATIVRAVRDEGDAALHAYAEARPA